MEKGHMLIFLFGVFLNKIYKGKKVVMWGAFYAHPKTIILQIKLMIFALETVPGLYVYFMSVPLISMKHTERCANCC